jgi:hypothetical protein
MASWCLFPLVLEIHSLLFFAIEALFFSFFCETIGLLGYVLDGVHLDDNPKIGHWQESSLPLSASGFPCFFFPLLLLLHFFIILFIFPNIVDVLTRRLDWVLPLCVYKGTNGSVVV